MTFVIELSSATSLPQSPGSPRLAHCTVFFDRNKLIVLIRQVRENSSVLLELLGEVVLDLADQSRIKLDSLTCKLLAESSGPVDPSSLKADGVDSASPTSKKVSVPAAVMLPCGEAGGRQHDR